MGVCASFLSGDPLGLARASCNLAVEAHGELCGHEWTAGQAMLHVELVQLLGPFLVNSDVDFDTCRFQHAEAGAADALIRVRHRDDDTTYACVDRDLSAWGAAMLMRAGLEVDVERALSRAVTGG
jgi:hypothetical protein